jgi:GTP-binding protein HflX
LITLTDEVKEIQELAESAGYEILFEIVQHRSRPDPVTFIGKGKVTDVQKLLGERDVDAFIINGDLKPSQHYLLENSFKKECLDRVRLVLDIFTLRANNKESRLQVERARLRYEVPLLREWIHSAKAGEHPGFLGGGEYAVNVYYDLIKVRLRRIDDELRKIGSTDRQRRAQRKRKGFNLVCFAGYTNAGKSSMMRALTGEEVFIQDKMFSTLSTTTKRLQGTSALILLTDTIGFLDDLPPFVIEAFKNTVEEIFLADLVLLVLDCSEELDEIRRKLSTSERILAPQVESERIVVVLNKLDKLSGGEERRAEIISLLHEVLPDSEMVFASARKGNGIEKVRSIIIRRFSQRNLFMMILPQTGETERLLTHLRDHVDIISIDYTNTVTVKGSCADADMKPLQLQVRALKGTLTFLEQDIPEV